MKFLQMFKEKWFMVLGIFLVSTVAFATIKGLPFLPEVDARFNTLENQTAGGTLTSGNVLVGNASNVSTSVTLSGDVTNDNAGVTAIGAGKVLESMLVVPTNTGLNALRIARVPFTFALVNAIGAQASTVSLPAKAIIIRSWIHIKTQFTDTGTCTLAISCEDANNIKTATDISGTAADGMIEGQSTGAASAFVSAIASSCAITFTVGDGGSCVPITGAGEVYVEYVVGS